MAADQSVKADWNSLATFGVLNSSKNDSPLLSPMRSPHICRSTNPFECSSPHRSPTVKRDSEGGGSPIPSYLALDRKARVSDRSSCDGVPPGSLEGSLHSSGFLTPPSRNSSPSHSDHVGARARLPPPMGVDSAKPIVAETASNWHWLRYPKLRLSEYQLKSYLWLPVTKEDPRPSRVESRKPSNSAGQSAKKNRNKSVSFAFDDVKQSIDRMRSMPVTPAISRRWSSTGFDQAITRGGSVTSNYLPARRLTIPFTDRGAEALTAIKERLTRRDIYAHQMETPTIITLRRASAVLGTVAQRQASIIGDPSATLPDKWQQACPEVPLAAYLITADEIHTLASLIRRTFADGTLQESSRALETVTEDEPKPRNNRSRSGSLVNRGKAQPEKKFPANVAITVADVHALGRSSTMARKGSFRTQMSRKTSIVSTMLARKSVHEIIWEDDGTPQSLRSSVWNASHDPSKNNATTWSTTAFRRESGESGLSVPEKQETPSSSSGNTSPGKRTPKPPIFKPVFSERPKCEPNGSHTVHPPQWKKGDIYELPFPGVIPGADDGPTPASMPWLIDDVVSFPPLPQRQSTSDWQVPPGDINSPVQTPNHELPNIFLRHPSATTSHKLGSSDSEDDENTLYRYGIDARIAPSVSRKSSTAPTTPTPLIKTSLWGGDETPVFGPQQQRRRSSAMPTGNILKKKVSNSKMGERLGASSGARRRSSTRVEHIRILSQKVDKEEGRAPWKKARKDSGYPGLAPPSSDEGSDVSIGEEEAAADERQALLGKANEKGKGKGSMVLQLPYQLRKKASGGAERLKRIVGKGERVREENEEELEEERRVWREEKARSPSPTRRNLQGAIKAGCGRVDCTRVGCGGGNGGGNGGGGNAATHSRPSTPASGNEAISPAKSEGGSAFSIERTNTGTYVLKSGSGSGTGEEEGRK